MLVVSCQFLFYFLNNTTKEDSRLVAVDFVQHQNKSSCSAVLLFCCSAVLLFCCSAVLLFCCSEKRTEEKRRRFSSASFLWRIRLLVSRTALRLRVSRTARRTACFKNRSENNGSLLLVSRTAGFLFLFCCFLLLLFFSLSDSEQHHFFSLSGSWNKQKKNSTISLNNSENRKEHLVSCLLEQNNTCSFFLNRRTPCLLEQNNTLSLVSC